jgi:osmoprotectant transport system substrate-binding protein
MRLFALGLTAAFTQTPSLAQTHPQVVVASKADTEGALLGSMIALVLEREGIPVELRLQLGSTQRLRSALLSGEIDLYPEYTGNGAFFHKLEGDPAWKSSELAFEKVRQLDAGRHKLVWLSRAPANNTWLIAVRGDVARRDNLTTMEDFAAAVRRSADLRLAASAEFVESPAALPSFERTYNFRFPRNRIALQPEGDTMTTMRAAARNADGVNAAMVYGTDGAIATLDLMVMKDIKGAQIVYEPAPVIRAETLQRYPKIAQVLAPVFGSLTMAKLQVLNAEIAIEEKQARDVAKRYLDGLAGSKTGPRTSP